MCTKTNGSTRLVIAEGLANAVKARTGKDVRPFFCHEHNMFHIGERSRKSGSGAKRRAKARKNTWWQQWEDDGGAFYDRG